MARGPLPRAPPTPTTARSTATTSVAPTASSSGFHTDWGNPAASRFSGPTNLPLAAFDSALCGFFSFACIPQPGTSTTLDPVNEWPMWRLQYRNFGSHEALVGNFVVDVDGMDHAGIRWFELRRSGSDAWAVFQQGTFAPQDSTIATWQ